MVTKNCPNCNHINPDNAKFCFSCGHKFSPPETIEEPKTFTKRNNIEDSSISRDLQKEKNIIKAKSPSNILFWIFSILLFLVLAGLLGFGVYWINQENSKINKHITFRAPEKPQVRTSYKISERELDRAKIIIEIFYNPAEVGSNFILYNLGDPTQKSTFKNGVAYKLDGILTRIAPLEKEFTGDYPEASLIEISGLENEVLVLYRGDLKLFKLGDPIEVSGVYNKEANMINAFQVQLMDKDPILGLWKNLWLLRIAIFTVIWMIFCATFLLWKSNRYSRFKDRIFLTFFSLIFIVLFTSACELNIKTTINSDGSGTISTSLIDTKENMEFFRKVPGLKGYLESWKKILRQSGFLVDHIYENQTEEILFQRSFGNLEELSVLSNDSEQSSWVFSEKYAVGDVVVYRFMASVDTTNFFEKIPGMDSNVQSMMRDEMNQLSLKYEIVMPGKIVYHNGQELNENYVVWQLKMNAINQILVEANMPIENYQTGESLDYLLILIMFVGIFLFSNILLIISLTKYKISRTQVI